LVATDLFVLSKLLSLFSSTRLRLLSFPGLAARFRGKLIQQLLWKL
jgi:hypothetical protein